MAEATITRKPSKQEAKKNVEEVEEYMPETNSIVDRIEEYSPPVLMGLTAGSIIASMVLFVRKARDTAIFVGIWAPTFLTLGLFYLLIGAGKRSK